MSESIRLPLYGLDGFLFEDVTTLSGEQKGFWAGRLHPLQNRRIRKGKNQTDMRARDIKTI